MAEKPNEGEQGGSPDLILGEIAGLLNVKGVTGTIPLLAAIRDKVKALVKGADGEPDDSDSGVASSVRELLGLEADAGRAEVVLAMRVGDTAGASVELMQMRQAESARLAQERVDKYVQTNQINPNDKPAMQAALSLAMERPDRFEALMGAVKPYVEPGRTTPPDSRSRLMLSAAREFKGDDALQNTTGIAAFVNLKLRDGGFEPMSEDEAREFSTV